MQDNMQRQLFAWAPQDIATSWAHCTPRPPHTHTHLPKIEREIEKSALLEHGQLHFWYNRPAKSIPPPTTTQRQLALAIKARGALLDAAASASGMPEAYLARNGGWGAGL